MERKFKFTKASVAKIPFSPGRQVVYWDTYLPGFGIYTSAKSKSYFVQGRVNGKNVKTKIERTDKISLDDTRDPDDPSKRVPGARTRAMDIISKMAHGINQNVERKLEKRREITLKEVREEYFRTKADLKPNTITTYTKLTDLYLSDWLSRSIRSITKEMVAVRHSKIGKEKGIHPANNTMRTLRALFNFARAQQEDLPENPVQRLTSTRQWYKTDRRQSIIMPSQIAAWYQEVLKVPNPDQKDLLLLILFTGLRREEACTLLWRNVNFEDRILTVEGTKNGSSHSLPLSGYLYELLKVRKAVHDQGGSGEFVFAGAGKSGHISAPYKRIKEISEATGIKFCLHDLRRTFVSIAESLDISYSALKKLLNHSTANDVTQGYIVVSVDRLRGPMDKVSRRILELAEKTGPAEVIQLRDRLGANNG